MNRFEALFRSLTIKGVTLRNRIVMPAMNTNFAEPDGSVSDRFEKYYVERGKGGVGLIIVSPGYIDPSARKRAGSLLYHEDRFIPRLTAFRKAIHLTGAKVLQQLNHNGRLLTSSKDLKTSAKPGSAVGPSAVPHLVTGEVPKVLTTHEIKEVIDKFGQAAYRAKKAGFDGVELLGGHGYLIHQFFSLYSNRRTDAYGGSLENRTRFHVEVYRRVRELTGDDFLISYRLSAQEFAPVETPLEDVIFLCQRLEREGVDLLDISMGNSEMAAMLLKSIPSGSTSRGCYADVAAAIKSRVKVPVMAVGRINTPEIADEILRKGQADLVATGRGLIADPYWPEKALRGEPEKIRRCIGCNQGCIERLVQEKMVTCLYNPEVGREGESPSMPERRKKVMVIGGGPGGMEAAAVAASRGHDVDLFEKGRELGGQALVAEVPPGKKEFAAVRDFLKNELETHRVLVHLNKEVKADDVLSFRPEVVILATGSIPTIPEIPGIDRANVFTLWDVLRGREVGKSVVVAGAGLAGVETALFLAGKGKEVTLVCKYDEIGRDAGPLNRARLKEALGKAGVEIRWRTVLAGIGEGSATLRNETETYEIPSEAVVLALGTDAYNPLYRDLEGKIPELYAIGDCVEPRMMIEAIHEAFDVALKI